MAPIFHHIATTNTWPGMATATGAPQPLNMDVNRTMTTMNHTICVDHWQHTLEYIKSIAFILPALTLTLFNIVVIIGNLLVIISVFSCKKLRTITNTYVVSLAFSDLSLGVLVLPFSGVNEVLRIWPFGEAWCYMWLALDVWICTASILNLCAISFDRYLAISRPFKYQTLISPVKAKILVTFVWLVAFLICLPPLIGWNERGESLLNTETTHTNTNITNTQSTFTIGQEFHNYSFNNDHVLYFNSDLSLASYITENRTIQMKECNKPSVCQLTSEPGYIIYSALGSFWIPVWIMVFFYWRIYMIAARTTRGVRRGVLRTKSKKGVRGNNGGENSPVTLRIHRGGTLNQSFSSRSNGSRSSQTDSLLPSSSPPQPSMNGDRPRRSICDIDETRGSNRYKQLKRNASVPAEIGCKEYNNCYAICPSSSKRPPKIKVTFCNSRNRSFGNSNNGGISRFSKLDEIGYNNNSHSNEKSNYKRNGVVVHCPIEEETSFNMSETCIEESSNSNSFQHRNGRQRPTSHKRLNFRNKIRTFNREKKAAKTVGIIVASFIFCWAPFFTVYLLGAVCKHCTPDLVFTIFFWLGYSNSAINPFVYALFSKDFRFAFKKLLMCRCERQKLSFKDRRSSRLRTFLSSLKIQISSRSSDDTQFE